MGNRALTPFYATPILESAGDRWRARSGGGFLDQRAPLHLHAVAGVESESAATSEPPSSLTPAATQRTRLRFLGIDRPALALDALEVALDQREAGQRFLVCRRKAGALA